MKTVSVSLMAVAALLFSALAQAMQVPGPLVEVPWLAAHAKQVVILDVRADTRSFTAKPVFRKDKKTGKEKLARVGGHIPGATLVDYKKVRVTRKVDGREVEYLIPPKADFEKLMQAAGVKRDSAVVIVTRGVGNLDMTMATRVYWQLKYYGMDNATILNGGMAAWLSDGKAVSTAAAKPKRGNWVATAERKDMLATSADVERAVKDGEQLVDNRPISQYLGVYKKSYVYAKGHIPGAKNFPNELLTEHGGPAKFLPTAELKTLSTELGIKPEAPTITYCNSGHLASGGWFIMHELMGNRHVKLYDGSMHEWTLEKHAVTTMKSE